MSVKVNIWTVRLRQALQHKTDMVGCVLKLNQVHKDLLNVPCRKFVDSTIKAWRQIGDTFLWFWGSFGFFFKAFETILGFPLVLNELSSNLMQSFLENFDNFERKSLKM
jgi:hypothetical protein